MARSRPAMTTCEEGNAIRSERLSSGEEFALGPPLARGRRLGAQPSNHDLDEVWAGRGDAFGEAAVEFLHRLDARARDPHRPRQARPVEVRTVAVEHVERLAAGV